MLNSKTDKYPAYQFKASNGTGSLAHHYSTVYCHQKVQDYNAPQLVKRILQGTLPTTQYQDIEIRHEPLHKNNQRLHRPTSAIPVIHIVT